MPHSDIFKEHYFAELSRRDSLNDSLSFPVGLVALIGGGVVAMANRVTPSMSEMEVILAIFLAIATACLIAATYFLIRSYWGYTYRHMPFAADLLTFKDSLVDYFSKLGHNDADAKCAADKEFYSSLDREYAKNCKLNAICNDTKSANIFKANAFIIGAIAALLVGAPAYTVLAFQDSKSTIVVEVANIKELAVTTAETPKEPQPAKPQEPIQAPVMPTMPPSRDVREHVDPSKKSGG